MGFSRTAGLLLSLGLSIGSEHPAFTVESHQVRKRTSTERRISRAKRGRRQMIKKSRRRNRK